MEFELRRNFKISTPCCKKSNKDGKFASFKGFSEYYGYCHSCGKTTLPSIDLITVGIKDLGINYDKQYRKEAISQSKKYIDEAIIWDNFHTMPENKLLLYLRSVYGDDKVDDAKETFALGSTTDGGTVFWNINSDLLVQKSKVCYYNTRGRRTSRFKVPYKNLDGFFSCLFGEHNIYESFKRKKTIILVESEKTAIVGYINLPQYVWVAYGGINGLTKDKMSCIIGHRVLLIPDMSENAVCIMYDKIPYMRSLGIDASVWDMTEGRTDQELKELGLYNCDLEDIFRKILR